MASALLIPWTATAPSFTFDVTVGVNTETLTLSLTSGRTYWLAGDGRADGTSGDGDLLALFVAALNTHSLLSSATATLDSAKRVTIDFGGPSASIDWGALDPALFGFSGVTASGATATGAARAYGWWLPGAELSFDSRNRRETRSAVRRSMTGAARFTYFGEGAGTREVSWEILDQSLALAEYAAEAGADFETWWHDHIARGALLRLFEDAAVVAFGTYQADDVGIPYERNERHITRWDVRLVLRTAGLAVVA